MAQAEQVLGLTKADLQQVLETVIKAAKEPDEATKQKMQQEAEARLGQFRQAAELAKTEESVKSRRWDGCPHAVNYKGQKYNKWQGQVNSNGLVVPVCNMCHVEAPPFSASLLPDQGKNGVNFEEWTWPDNAKALLVELHQKSFPKGCGKSNCVACKKTEKVS